MKIERDNSEDRSDTSEIENISDIDKSTHLTVAQLKSRLNEMNVKLDTQLHPKIFYLSLYNEAINDPEKRILLKKRIDEERGVRTRHKNKNMDFVKIKRKRSEEKPEVENNNKNENSKFFISSIKMNNNLYATESPFKNLSQIGNSRGESTPISNSCNSNIFASPKISSERRIISSNVKVHSLIVTTPKQFQQEEIKKANAGESLERGTLLNGSDYTNKEIILGEDVKGRIVVTDKLSNEMDVDVNEKGTETSNKEVDTIMTNEMSNNEMDVEVNGNFNNINNNDNNNLPQMNKYVNKDITNEDTIIKKLELTERNSKNNSSNSLINIQGLKRVNSSNTSIPRLELPKLLHNSDFRRHQSASSLSCHSQPLGRPATPFRHPNNQVFINEYEKASGSVKSSSKSLGLGRTAHIVNSINRTNIQDNNEINLEVNNSKSNCSSSSPTLFKDALRFFLMGVSVGAIGSCLITFLTKEDLKNISLPDLPSFGSLFENMDYKTCVALSVASIFVFIIAYLVKKNNEAVEREYKLIAENSFEEIKKFLAEKNISLPAETFIEQFCETNKFEVEDFKNKVLPFIKDKINHDDVIEETHRNIDGNAKVVWKLQDKY